MTFPTITLSIIDGYITQLQNNWFML